jgi:dTDP-D-glucose 4,6-dehydratase
MGVTTQFKRLLMSVFQEEKNVLLTGGDGFVGSNLLHFLLKETRWRFTCICSWRHKGNPLNIVRDERVRVVTHDLTGPIPPLGSFEYILHLASESHVDRSITDPLNFIENNVSSTLQLLEYSRKYRPDVFLLFSTDEVYGAGKHEEWDVLLPSNPYAASKASQEMCSIAYWRTYNVPLVITNSNNIIGCKQNSEKFLPKIIESIGLGKKINIHSYNGIIGRRRYLSVRSVSHAIAYILGKPPLDPTKSRYPSRYGLPGGKEFSNLELLEFVAEIIGIKPSYEIIDVSDIRPGYDLEYAETRGFLNSIGWEDPFDASEEIKQIVHSLRSDGDFHF